MAEQVFLIPHADELGHQIGDARDDVFRNAEKRRKILPGDQDHDRQRDTGKRRGGASQPSPARRVGRKSAFATGINRGLVGHGLCSR